MRKLINSTFVLFAAAIIFSCKKTDHSIEQISELRRSCERVDFSQLDIGSYHNQYVLQAYSNVDFNDIDNLKQNILNEFESISFDPSALSISHADFFEHISDQMETLALSNYDIRNVSNHGLTEEAFVYIDLILDRIDSISNLSSFNSQMDVLYETVSINLNCEEADYVLGTILIAKSSAYLWAPTDIGGYGLYDQTFSGSPNYQKKWWKRALVGDVTGSASYFLGFGTGLAVGIATPGANVAILGGWAISARIGSAFGALGI